NILSLAFAAIEAMPSRNGTSVQAILKHMKANGFEVNDNLRISKLVLKNLKAAVVRGELEQVKRSFKLSAATKNKSKALEKMKQKKANAKEKQKNDEMKEKQKPKGSAKAKTISEKSGKMKASERKTKEPSKKAKKDKAAAASAAASMEKDSEMPVDEQKKTTKSKVSAAEKKSKVSDPESSSNSKAKSKTARKSIGTLAQQVGKKKVASKKVKLVVAAKNKGPMPLDEGDSEFTDSAPTDVSTPIRPLKAKATRKAK
ncbi:hypothetical protein KR044_011397, partial [Drosophila immigrans]